MEMKFKRLSRIVLSAGIGPFRSDVFGRQMHVNGQSHQSPHYQSDHPKA